MTNDEALTLWKSCVINPDKVTQCHDVAFKLLAHWLDYKAVADQFAMPPWVPGILHYRESNFNFGTFLCNGDPIFDENGTPIVTTHVPSGLGPCNTWVDAAVESFKHQGYGPSYHWDVANALLNCEMYNGLGYRNMGKLSPYVWSFTNHYSKGKYSSDGVYDPNLVDKQAGCAALMLTLKGLGVVID